MTRVINNKWCCRKCSFENTHKRSTCEACGGDNPFVLNIPVPSWRVEAEYGQLLLHVEEPQIESTPPLYCHSVIKSLRSTYGKFLGLKLKIVLRGNGRNGDGKVFFRKSLSIPKTGPVIVPTELQAGLISAGYIFNHVGPSRTGPVSKPESFTMPNPIEDFKIYFDGERCGVELSWSGETDLEIKRALWHYGHLRWRSLARVKDVGCFFDTSPPPFRKAHYRLVCPKTAIIFAEKAISTIGPPKKPDALSATIIRDKVVLESAFSGKPRTTRAEWVLRFEDGDSETIPITLSGETKNVWEPDRFGRMKIDLVQWHKTVKRVINAGQLEIILKASQVQLISGPRCLKVIGRQSVFCRSILLTLLKKDEKVDCREITDERFQYLIDDLEEETQYTLRIKDSFFKKERKITRERLLFAKTLPKPETLTELNWQVNPWQLTWKPLANAHLLVNEVGLKENNARLSGSQLVAADLGVLKLNGIIEPPAIIEVWVNQYGQVRGPTNLLCIPEHSVVINECLLSDGRSLQLDLHIFADVYGGKIEIRDTIKGETTLEDFNSEIILNRQVDPWCFVEFGSARLKNSIRSNPIITHHFSGSSDLIRFLAVEWVNPRAPILIFDPPKEVMAYQPRVVVIDGDRKIKTEVGSLRFPLDPFEREERHKQLTIQFILESPSGPVVLKPHELKIVMGPELVALRSGLRWAKLEWMPPEDLNSVLTTLEYKNEGKLIYQTELAFGQKRHVFGPISRSLNSLQAETLPVRSSKETFIGPSEADFDRNPMVPEVVFANESVDELTLQISEEKWAAGGEVLVDAIAVNNRWIPVCRFTSPGVYKLQYHLKWLKLRFQWRRDELCWPLKEIKLPCAAENQISVNRIVKNVWLATVPINSQKRTINLGVGSTAEEVLDDEQSIFIFEGKPEWEDLFIDATNETDQIRIMPSPVTITPRIDQIEYGIDSGNPVLDIYFNEFFLDEISSKDFDTNCWGIELEFEENKTTTYWVDASRTVRLPASQNPIATLKIKIWLIKTDGAIISSSQVSIDVYHRPVVDDIRLSEHLYSLKIKGFTYAQVGELEAWAIETQEVDCKTSKLQVSLDSVGRFVIDDFEFKRRICPAYKIVHKVNGIRLITRHQLLASDNPKLPGRMTLNIIRKVYTIDLWGCEWLDINKAKNCRVVVPKESAEQILCEADALREEKMIWALEPLDERTFKKSMSWLCISRSVLLLSPLLIGLGLPGMAILAGLWLFLLVTLIDTARLKMSWFGGFWCYETARKNRRMPRLPRFLKVMSANLQTLLGLQPREIGLFPVKSVPAPLKFETAPCGQITTRKKSFTSITVGNAAMIVNPDNPNVFSTPSKSWLLEKCGAAWKVTSIDDAAHKVSLQPGTTFEFDGVKVTINSPEEDLDFMEIIILPEG